MTRPAHDLFVIGAGSGGVRAARVAAGLGARVAIAENRFFGGTCVNVGCIPKKLLVYASHFREEIEDAPFYGWSVPTARFDWRTLVANKTREIERLRGVYRKLLDQAGVESIVGRATVLDPHTVEVGDRRFTAENILVATGGWPALPDTPGVEHAITSNEAFYLSELPRRMVIVGGGYIGVELAGVFNGLGVETVLLYRGPLFLRGFDDDIRLTLAEEMRRSGVDVRFETDIAALARTDDGVMASLRSGGTIEADQILFATGRDPLTRDMGLEENGVELRENGAIVVDEYSRSTVPSIWAIGDATDRMALTPVAIHEGMAVARSLFGSERVPPDHENVPTAVFSEPPVATVGLSEADARLRFGELDVYRSRFRVLKHTLTDRENRTMMKLVVERAGQRVVGAHMVGPDAPEIMQGLAVAIKMGATKADFDATIGIHPTSAEEFVTMREPAKE